MPDNSGFVKSIDQATLKIVLEEKRKMNTACLIVERQAKQDCPVDTGVLSASITHEVEMSVSEIVGRIGSNLEIAPYVHNGTGIYAIDGNGRKTPWTYVVKAGKYKGGHYTVGQRPKPFLKYAVLFNMDKIMRTLGD